MTVLQNYTPTTQPQLGGDPLYLRQQLQSISKSINLLVDDANANHTKILLSAGGANPISFPTQTAPVDGLFAAGGLYNDSSPGNIFVVGAWADNSGTRPTVAVFGQGRATGTNGRAWGGNFVGYAQAPGAFAQGVEIDFGVANGIASQEANGLSINVGGTTGTPGTNLTVGLQFDQLAAAGVMTDAIRFGNFAGGQPYSHALIFTSGSTPLTCSYGINLLNSNFGTAAITTPGFTVAPTGLVTIGASGGASGSLTLNGSTSGSANISVTSTGTPNYGATVTNDSAAAGAIGEYVTANATGVAISGGSPGATVNVCSISLTAGDWDVSALCIHSAQSITPSSLMNFAGSISATSATTDGMDTRQANHIYPNSLLTGAPRFVIGPSRFSLSATTTIYLVAFINGTYTGTATVGGTIRARRVR